MNNNEQKNQILDSVCRKMASELVAASLKDNFSVAELAKQVDVLTRQLYADQQRHLQELREQDENKAKDESKSV